MSQSTDVLVVHAQRPAQADGKGGHGTRVAMGLAVAGVNGPGKRPDGVLQVESVALGRLLFVRSASLGWGRCHVDARATARLGPVERRVGAGDQLPELICVSREQGDSGADGECLAGRTELDRSQGEDQATDYLLGQVRSGPDERDQELVSTHSPT